MSAKPDALEQRRQPSPIGVAGNARLSEVAKIVRATCAGPFDDEHKFVCAGRARPARHLNARATCAKQIALLVNWIDGGDSKAIVDCQDRDIEVGGADILQLHGELRANGTGGEPWPATGRQRPAGSRVRTSAARSSEVSEKSPASRNNATDRVALNNTRRSSAAALRESRLIATAASMERVVGSTTNNRPFLTKRKRSVRVDIRRKLRARRQASNFGRDPARQLDRSTVAGARRRAPKGRLQRRKARRRACNSHCGVHARTKETDNARGRL